MSQAARVGRPRAQPTITERGDITQQGRWFADGDGRALLTAGVNMVYKLDHYTPEASGFDGNDADWLVKQGFDSVRLGFIWKAVEPEPGVYDDEYIESVRQTTRMLTDRGIMVLLDAHQYQYNEAFQGEFAPDWAVITDEVPSTLPLGFPANQVGNIGLLRALDNFLANRKGPGGVGLQDRFAAMWGHFASKFKDEPWAGSSWPICVAALGDCGVAKQGLDQMHDKVTQEITANDPRAIVHYEPFSTWNQGWNTRPAPPTTGASSTASLPWPARTSPAGNTGPTVAAMTPTTHNQKQQGIVADPKVPGPVSDRATEPHKVAILAAPHARAIAGTPTETT